MSIWYEIEGWLYSPLSESKKKPRIHEGRHWQRYYAWIPTRTEDCGWVWLRPIWQHYAFLGFAQCLEYRCVVGAPQGYLTIRPEGERYLPSKMPSEAGKRHLRVHCKECHHVTKKTIPERHLGFGVYAKGWKCSKCSGLDTTTTLLPEGYLSVTEGAYL